MSGEGELLVPFVVTRSHGGPFDDDAYVAGFEIGRLWSDLSRLIVPMTRHVHRANVGQADLIAMHYGATATVEAAYDDESPDLVEMTFSPPSRTEETE